MACPRYRRFGQPVTSVSMEPLVEQIGRGVKGPEIFRPDAEGAAAILRIRAAALRDNDRLTKLPAPPPRLPLRPPSTTNTSRYRT